MDTRLSLMPLEFYLPDPFLWRYKVYYGVTRFFMKDKKMLNMQFAKVFSTSSPNISPPDSVMNSPKLSDISTSEDEVWCLLSSLSEKIANGPDNVSSRMLKATADTIAPSLTHIFNQSLCHGQFPDDWKNTNITPVYKAGDPKLTSNYPDQSRGSLYHRNVSFVTDS